MVLTLIHDADVSHYHGWVVPEGSFTDRGREVPPGREGIDATEREISERASMAATREYSSEPHPDAQRTPPSLVTGRGASPRTSSGREARGEPKRKKRGEREGDFMCEAGGVYTHGCSKV